MFPPFFIDPSLLLGIRDRCDEKYAKAMAGLARKLSLHGSPVAMDHEQHVGLYFPLSPERFHPLLRKVLHDTEAFTSLTYQEAESLVSGPLMMTAFKDGVGNAALLISVVEGEYAGHHSLSFIGNQKDICFDDVIDRLKVALDYDSDLLDVKDVTLPTDDVGNLTSFPNFTNLIRRYRRFSDRGPVSAIGNGKNRVLSFSQDL